MIPKCLGSIEDDNGNGWSEGEREELSGWFAFRHDLTIKGQVNLWEVLFLPSFFIIFILLIIKNKLSLFFARRSMLGYGHNP